MSITVQITDAAHKYGLDNVAFNADYASAIIGTVTSVSDNPPTSTVGVPVTATAQTSNGFTVTELITLTSPTTGNLTHVQYLKNGELLLSGAGVVSFNTATIGQDLAGAHLFAGNDTIVGNSFDNKLEGGAGNDRIDGGAGTDTAIFQGIASQYVVSRSGTAMTVSGPDGTDTLLNVERLAFDDRVIAYDTSGAAGEAYRLYQAAFNRAPDVAGLGYWINALDKGAALNDVGNAFVGSAEFDLRYGPLDTNGYVNQLYLNVLHRVADSPGLAFWAGHLAAGDLDRAQVLVYFSESPENQAALIGTIQNGMTYQAAA